MERLADTARTYGEIVRALDEVLVRSGSPPKVKLSDVKWIELMRGLQGTWGDRLVRVNVNGIDLGRE